MTKKVTKKKARPKYTTGRKPNPGLPKHEPTLHQRALVSGCVEAGIPQEIVAVALGISRSTLNRHYKPQLENINAGKGATALALKTVISIMAEGTREIDRLRAAMFWLRTRENELFSERRIQENIDQAAADELGKITEEQAINVAENVLKAARLNGAARQKYETASIDDEPQGNA